MTSVQSFMFSQFTELQHRCSDASKATDGESPCLQKCLMKCQGVTSHFPKAISGGQISYFLQQYAEAILDFTYHDENLLTEEEFPESTSRDRIATIFDDLEKIKSMCDKISPGRRPEELLGNEIAECLLWRKGALLYMYCSTVQQDSERIKKDKQDYRKRLQKGVHYLQSMFKIRDLVLNTAQVPGENDTLGLFKMGIYSDTHLLALMYGGEMCSWFVKSGTEMGEQESAARALGLEMLETYVKAIHQFSELQGWSTDTAKQLIAEMKSIYSDTYLLALMYGGEMCSWFVKSGTEMGEQESAARALGLEMLETYVKAIHQFSEVQGWSTDTAKQLIAEMKSIYSDTHLLALMYGGEMCSWFVKSGTEMGEHESAARALGLEMLETYVKAIHQFSELQGWSTDTAKQLIAELKS